MPGIVQVDKSEIIAQFPYISWAHWMEMRGHNTIQSDISHFSAFTGQWLKL